ASANQVTRRRSPVIGEHQRVDAPVRAIADQEQYELAAVLVAAVGDDEIRPDAGERAALLDPDILEVFAQRIDACVVASLCVDELLPRAQVGATLGRRVGRRDGREEELFPLIQRLTPPKPNVVGDDALEGRIPGWLGDAAAVRRGAGGCKYSGA